MFNYIFHSVDSRRIRHLSAEFDVRQNHIRFTCSHKLNLPLLRKQLQQDINLIPADFDSGAIKLFVTDMDSSLITIECIDEMADLANIKDSIARITEDAMQGKIDFTTALNARVSLLKGLPISALQRVYDERLHLSGGSETLINFFQTRAVKCALVSGGFTFFTERIKNKLKLDDALANELMIDHGQLTGEICGDVVDATAKADFVRRLVNKYDINLTDTLIVGDGANDIPMLKLAGLSIGYHAKDSVKAIADIVIDYGDFNTVLHLFDG